MENTWYLEKIVLETTTQRSATAVVGEGSSCVSNNRKRKILFKIGFIIKYEGIERGTYKSKSKPKSKKENQDLKSLPFWAGHETSPLTPRRLKSSKSMMLDFEKV
ncbi:hypothetical protein DSO57_1033304 [Entomophthora muscae]|uniref:Uncharacterized protein n=1 Tax=Entomophthora muscae TaxID=34485 RepID=A0ACC2SD32_9FUNG|nr:hypothetical protein DSO57_1033304 [Entomophthora muscae]